MENLIKINIVKLSGFFLLILFSCNNVSINNDNPNTLSELQHSFNELELKKEIVNFKKDTITIIATGHLYPLIKHPKVYKLFIDRIKEQKPDMIFLLGDIVFNNSQDEWDSVFNKFNDYRDKLYFSPGNHDLNYHYERYNGSREHEFEAEMRFLNNVGYRYKVIESNLDNFILLNMNDSIDRVIKYIQIAKSKISSNKRTLILSSQCLWHDNQQNPNDVRTWPLKSFSRDEILPSVKFADYLIHGDWNSKFYQGEFPKPESDSKFNVIAVGNKRVGDPLMLTKLTLTKDTLIAKPIIIDIPNNSTWFNGNKK